MELVLALGISGFILINPLNFRALSTCNKLNVLCVHYRGKAMQSSDWVYVEQNRLEEWTFPQGETQVKCSATDSVILLTNGKVSNGIISKILFHYEFQLKLGNLEVFSQSKNTEK